MFEALKKYAQFSGRATRKEYWLFVLLVLIITVATTLISLNLYILVSLGFLLPGLAVTVRRFHDIDKSGWWYLFVLFIPIIGTIMGLIWACTKGTLGTNRFGDDPLQEVK